MDEDRIKGAVSDLTGRAKDVLGNSDVVRSFGADLQRLTQERPLVALLLAAGIGYGLRSVTHPRR